MSKVFKVKSIRRQALVGRGVERFLYVYDFGDDWRHNVTIEDVRYGGAPFCMVLPMFADRRKGPLAS